MKRKLTIRNISTALAITSGIIAIGIFGAMECGNMSVYDAFFRGSFAIASAILFAIPTRW